jgi:hypothetical protein
MKLIFIGSLYHDKIKEKILKNSIQMPYFAADTHQKAIIEGLDNYVKDLKIINAPHLPNFPFKYKKAYFKYSEWSHNNLGKDVDIAFLNVFGIKHFWRMINITRALYRSIKEFRNNNKHEKITVITYGLHLPFLVATYINKMFFKSTKWCMIIPEIPKFYIFKPRINKFYKLLKKIDWKITLSLVKFADSYELITKQMADFFKISIKPYIVIEAIVINKEYKQGVMNNNLRSNELKVIAYTGTTSIEFGIEELLKSFTLIKKRNYRLMIYGTGSGDYLIKKYSLIDNRIIHKGFVDREEILCVQKEATLLINPRNSFGEYTKYSFPSKTVEYMLSGTIVLMHNLPGMPQEYLSYVKTFNSNNLIEMSIEIEEICELPEEYRKQFGANAQNFVIKEKNSIVQGNKLYEMLKKSF